MDARPQEGVEKYPFYPKPAPGTQDWSRYSDQYDVSVEIDTISGQQIVVACKKSE